MKTFTRVRSIANTLRVLAVAWILSGICCFFPDSWDNAFLALFGVEPVPQGIPMIFVLRWAGVGCVWIGIMIWVVATDVVRYRPIVIAIIALHLIAAPVAYFMELVIGMPLSWRIMDSVSLLVLGVIPLVFCLWPAKESPNAALEPTPAAR
jgi:hypothetical protein